MDKLATKLQYEAKQAELRKLVDVEAKKLQDIVDAKESSLREIHDLAERKASLVKVIDQLEQQIKDKQESFNNLIESQNNSVASFKLELAKEKKDLRLTSSLSKGARDNLEALALASEEIESFIRKGTDVREKYLKQKSDLAAVENKMIKIFSESDKKEKDAENKLKDLDQFKTYLTDLYGRVATYVVTAKETIEFINEELERKKVPLRFVPPGELMEIDLDNFDKQYEQT